LFRLLRFRSGFARCIFWPSARNSQRHVGAAATRRYPLPSSKGMAMAGLVDPRTWPVFEASKPHKRISFSALLILSTSDPPPPDRTLPVTGGSPVRGGTPLSSAFLARAIASTSKVFGEHKNYLSARFYRPRSLSAVSNILANSAWLGP